MSDRGKARHVFTSSNSQMGFYTFVPALLEGLRKIFILKGAAGTGKTTFIRLTGEALADKGYEVEFWVSALDPINPEGVYIPQLEAAVVNGSLPCLIDPRYPGVTGFIVNLGDYIDKAAAEEQGEEIIKLLDRLEEYNLRAAETLNSAARIKEQQKQIAAAHLNLEKIHKLSLQIAGEIMEGHCREKHYFASAVTLDGVVNYVHEISANCKKRYIFKGPMGSGKSTVIGELARTAGAKGHMVEYYHCGFQPESLLMIIIPSLQVALIDAGDIEITPKPWDTEINMRCCLDNYDEQRAGFQNAEALRHYESLMLKAQQDLECAHRTLKSAKKLYSGMMDFTRLEEKRQEVLAEILEMGKQPQIY